MAGIRTAIFAPWTRRVGVSMSPRLPCWSSATGTRPRLRVVTMALDLVDFKFGGAPPPIHDRPDIIDEEHNASHERRDQPRRSAWWTRSMQLQEARTMVCYMPHWAGIGSDAESCLSMGNSTLAVSVTWPRSSKAIGKYSPWCCVLCVYTTLQDCGIVLHNSLQDVATRNVAH